MRLAREGRGPERLLLLWWRDREVSWERELRPEEIVPVSDCALRLMEVTCLELSHLTPSHMQNMEMELQNTIM